MPKKILLALSLFVFSLSTYADPLVRIVTNKGDIDIQLNSIKAPLTVKNFLAYVKDGSYNGTIFHRVIKDFMIQGGGFTQDLQRKPTHAPVQNEAFNGLKNSRGTIAMARTNDPHSATAQFFINTSHNDFLNFKSKTARGWGYTVFGKVSKGIEIVNDINTVKTGGRGMFAQDVPIEDIIIKKIEIISE
ncbi:Peptidyl-prolyl cis-trans isomerase PpiB [hydrothermal vent metagenome]|uniref:peptidylprolyl isomerase n=1 Tax=hydrothermal vent metagenome TaxID=652676 RepID=A0A3B0X681_9ZZZZ